MGAAAAAALLLGAFISWLMPGNSNRLDNSLASADTSVGRLIWTENAIWERGSIHISDLLEPGWVRLESGAAEIEFHSGATVVLEGPAAMRLETDMQCYFEIGTLAATVPPDASGFTILSRGGKVIDLGTSFGIDAAVVTSDLNFRRIFPNRPAGLIDIGLIDLVPGADPVAMRDEIDALLPDDVHVYTRDDFIRAEVAYWNSATPIGFVFFFGTVIGIVVGAIIVYQILFADVSEHIQEYATLKAMGYSDGYLFKVVLQEAAILAVLGFVPGLLVCLALYRLALYRLVLLRWRGGCTCDRRAG